MTQRRPPCRSTLTDLCERRFELLQFAVDRNANRLEGLRRRMAFRRACGGAAASTIARQLQRSRQSAIFAGSDNRARNTCLRVVPRHSFAILRSNLFHPRTRASHWPIPESGSIRMSSGPSRMKLKPRSASSSCGDETPRSKSNPSTCRRGFLSLNDCLKLRNFASDQFESRIVSKACGADAIACGSRSMAISRPFAFKLLQNFPAVTPAPKRSVDVTAVWFYFQSFKDRPQQHRHMRVAAHGLTAT